MLPPESLPRPSGDPPAAMIAASPLELPAGLYSGLYGLLVRPYTSFCTPTFVLPSRMPPAARSRATTVASRAGIRSRCSSEPPRARQTDCVDPVLDREGNAVQRTA